MPNPRMKHTRLVHKSTAGILKPIPEAVDLVGNPPPALTTNTVAPLQQRGSANRGSLCYAEAPVAAARFYTALSAVHQFIEDKLSWFDTADHLPGNRGRTIFTSRQAQAQGR
jgi:hypothetical protein